jgi:hypothetical protein
VDDVENNIETLEGIEPTTADSKDDGDLVYIVMSVGTKGMSSKI